LSISSVIQHQHHINIGQTCQIKLGGPFDLQLLELALRIIGGDNARLLHGLAKTLAKYLSLPREWTRVKDAGVKLFASELGGDGSIWDTRPLKEELITYSAQDVAFTFDLYDTMLARIPERQRKVWENRILKEAVNRINEAQDARWVGRCRERALVPARGWGI
jgi:exonuclease 3'-5' domain-containing protein 1